MGSIPARAGQPSSAGSCATTPTVYPRTRGATRVRPRLELQAWLRQRVYPRTRGATDVSVELWRRRNCTQVYPRTRGATGPTLGLLPGARSRGLSPHARGNRQVLGRGMQMVL